MGNAIVKKFAFLPPPVSYTETYPTDWIPKGETAKEGRIPAVFVQQCRRALPITILYSHGNAEDIGQLGDWLNHVATSLSINVLFYDYSGYGLNQPSDGDVHSNASSPCESFCYRDIEKCWKFLVDVKHIPPHCVILMGRSIGSGPTTFLAEKLSHKRIPFGGLVLQSPVASCVRVVSTALSYVPFTDMFSNIHRIGSVAQPTLIFHGERDQVVPYAHGVDLWSKTQKSSQWRFVSLPNAGHNDIEANCYEILLATLSEFVEFVLNRPPPPLAAASTVASAGAGAGSSGNTAPSDSTSSAAAATAQ